MNETSDVSNSKFYTYILYSLKDNGYYIGYTNNLKRRLTQHARGQVDATENRLPLKLIHYEYFICEGDAKAREKYLKSGYGRLQFSSILRQTLVKLSKSLSSVENGNG